MYKISKYYGSQYFLKEIELLTYLSLYWYVDFNQHI